MKHPRPTTTPGLSRHSVGLTPAHRELIKVLAGIAVTNYLRECEAAEVEGTEEPADHEEAIP
jgi:hypothetical protein